MSDGGLAIAIFCPWKKSEAVRNDFELISSFFPLSGALVQRLKKGVWLAEKWRQRNLTLNLDKVTKVK